MLHRDTPAIGRVVAMTNTAIADPEGVAIA
jgi:hypothetical protein